MSEISRDFRASFDPAKQKIELELAELDNLPASQIRAATDVLAVKTLSEKLSQQRAKLIPKPKFTFKSRKALATSASSGSPSSSSALAVSSTKNNASAADASVDQSLFMKFENRTGEHLFIGTLLVSLPLPASDSPMAMEQDIYLGGVPVPSAAAAKATAKDVALTNLTDCTVNLVHEIIPLGAIHIKSLKRCVLVIPPVAGSILLHDCEGCVIVGACHQSRMHTSTDMDIYLHVTSDPIIEDCTDMRFAPYPYHDLLPAEYLHRLFAAANLSPDVNYYSRVKDFNWLRQQVSPNWRLLQPHELRLEVAQAVLMRDLSQDATIEAATTVQRHVADA
ncbi:hypothetical protein BGZ98_006302 [Dissophora globulifera]|nr:hypothetical protein BGZ98_006302 [Dissophora globulifera]